MSVQLEQLKTALADRYAVEQEIGSGGMAIVYLAQDLKHNRRVAIKVLRPDVSAELSSERFLREIETAAGLSHPHILPVYDSGDADGVLYYVMPFVDGESLRERIHRERQLPIEDALRIAREIGSALSFAHDQGVVHRDVKPENVLISGGHAVIADFGIARAVNEAGGQRLTGTGLAIGTPTYMSPEQASGEDVDARADVYAMGCLVFEMLAGQPPFTGPSAGSVIHQHLAVDAPSISGIRPTVGLDVARAIQRALAKTPADRFRTAGEFADALGADGTGTRSMAATVRSLFGGRVLKSLGIYAVAATLLVLFLDVLVNRLALSPHLPTFGLVALVTLLPTALLLAYKRAQPAGIGWSTLNKLTIPANLLGSAAILFLMFGAKELGAVTTTVTIENEAGESVKRVVPKSEFRKRIAIFPLNNMSGDTANDWLQHGASLGMAVDLRQDLFIDVRALGNFKEDFQQAGFPSATNVPLALLRRLADEKHREYFVSGQVGKREQEFTVATELYETRRGRLVADREFVGDDFFALIDQATLQLKRDMDIPDSYIDEAPDLPVRETLTSSLEAYESYIRGVDAILMQDDWQVALPLIDAAVTIDPTFAIAHVELYTVAILGNQSQRAFAALQGAMDHLYRLSERDQFVVKINYYQTVRREPEAALAVAKMRVELLPDDIEGRLILATLYSNRGDRRKIIEQFEQVIAIDPTQLEYLKELGRTHEELGEFDAALRHLHQYAEQFPNEAEVFSRIASVHRRKGEFDDARANLERARLNEPENVSVQLALARLDLDSGNFEAALTRTEQALAESKTPQDRARVLVALASQYRWRGQLQKAVEQQERAVEAAAAFQPAAVVLLDRLGGLGLYVEAGQRERAFQIVEQIGAQLSAPFDQFLSRGYLEIYLALENADSAEAAAQGVDAFIEAFAVEVLRPKMLEAQGRIQEMRGQYEAAIESYRRQLELDPVDVGINTDLGRCYRLLGDDDKAEEHLERTLTVQPSSGRALLQLGLVHADRGDSEQAVEALGRALEVWADADPNYKPAQEARAKYAELTATN